jgi:similar to stage IV sporulation protein
MMRVEGRSPERLLNCMLQAGMRVWSVRRIAQNAITAEIRAGDFARLCVLARDIRCSAHIVERRGMPFLLCRLRTRKTLALCLGLGFLLVLLAQTRVWAIDIKGLYIIPQSVIEDVLERQGIYIGMPRGAVVPLRLGNEIRAHDERIAWAGAHLDGVALSIRVVEAKVIPARPDKSKPADVAAQKDGIIARVTALSGKAAVEEGDAVRSGDTLIRGDITREGAQKRVLVHACGEVMARVYYTAEKTLPATRAAMGRSGSFSEYHALYIAGRPILLHQAPYDAYEIVPDRQTAMKGLVLPVRVVRGSCYELVLRQTPMAREELLAEALFLAELEALWMVEKDARILDKQTQTRQNGDGSVTATVTVCALEEIGVSRVIAGELAPAGQTPGEIQNEIQNE